MAYTFSTRSGSSLYVEDTGSGPPVLALHGIGGGAYFFGGFAKRLESHYRVLSVDLPGTGNSISGAQPFTIESIVADLGDLVADKIGEPVAILGHSFGTIVALKAWEMWPQKIRAMIFACGLPKVRPNVHERLSIRAEDISKNGILGWGERMSAGVFSKATFRDQPEMIKLVERIFESQNPASYLRSIELLLGADVRTIVPTVKVPCMAVIGAEDSYAPPESAREFISQIPVGCEENILPGYAHMPFFEAPELFAKTVGKFLGSLAGSLRPFDKLKASQAQ